MADQEGRAGVAETGGRELEQAGNNVILWRIKEVLICELCFYSCFQIRISDSG